MAERRMISKKIFESDAFLEMPLSSQALYFHLLGRADDDGFLNNALSIMKVIGANKNDYDLLIAKNFIITFDDGICVIKHWRIHNYVRGDRYKPTQYAEEKAMLNVKENGAYTLDSSVGTTIGIPDGYRLDTQDRLGKDRLGKDRLGKENTLGAKNAPHYDNEELNQAFLDFVDMRKKIKKPLTERAIEMQKKKLKELTQIPYSDDIDTELAIKILNQSTMNCWQGLFELKESKADTIKNRVSEVDNWV